MNAPTLRAANRQAFYKTEVVAMGEFERKPFDDIGTDTNIPADSEREFSAKIADVDIRDDFMFSYVMCNPQICIEKRIQVHFDADHLEGKAENKRLLQERLGLEQRDVPIIGMITRLADQKGLDILSYVFDEMMCRDVQFVHAGRPDRSGRFPCPGSLRRLLLRRRVGGGRGLGEVDSVQRARAR